MRGFLGKLVLVSLFAQMLSCVEVNDETKVWGTIQVDTMATATRLDGETLAPKGADLVGSCKLENNRFGFTLGSNNKNSVTGGDFYYEIYGIPGPPSQDPYTEGGALRSNENRSFTSGYVWVKTGEWSIAADDILDNCDVSLFAAAGPNDFTPLSFGKKEFEYVVKIDCYGGLDYIPNNQVGQDLAGIRAELWFANCD